MQRPITLQWQGLVDYPSSWQAMKAYTDSRDGHSNDQLWLLEHPPVYTQGQAGKPEHILLPQSIPVVNTDRGGQVTYHGPGQLVGYPLLDLTRLALGPRHFVERIEDALVRALNTFGIDAVANREAHGVYVAGRKIASLGMRIRRGCSYHGFALNVAMDMIPFQGINPCGYAGLQMCQLQDFVTPRASLMAEARAAVIGGLQHTFPELDFSSSKTC